MAHLTSRQGYRELVERLNRAPQGAPPSPLLDRILELLFGEEDAQAAAQLPLRPFTPRRAARIWRVSAEEAKERLDNLAERSLLVDIVRKEETHYVLPPPMIGFFEFALMRVREDVDQQLLSELLEQYVTVEDGFMLALTHGGTTQQARMLVHEDMVSLDDALEVLDYERASAIIDSATAIGVGLCYCRHKRAHLGRACQAPLEICLCLNLAAESLIRHQVVRRITKEEAHSLLQQARAANLAHFADNVQHSVNFICNCCPCCCEAMIAARRFGLERPLHTSNFIVAVTDRCTGCGRCIATCPVRILSLESTAAEGRGRKRIAADLTYCLGCGVCVRNCPRGGLRMERRPRRVITPVNSTHKAVLMALERGRLQHLLFDNRTLRSHRALTAIFGAVLRLTPAKRLLACEQIGSRYLGNLCARYERMMADA